MEAQIFDPNLPLRILDWNFAGGIAVGLCLSARSIKFLATLKLTPEQKERRLSAFDLLLHGFMTFVFTMMITAPLGFLLSSDHARWLFGCAWAFLLVLHLAAKIQLYTVEGSNDICPTGVYIFCAAMLSGAICAVSLPSTPNHGGRCKTYDCAQYLD